MEEEKWYKRIRDIRKWRFKDFLILLVIVITVELLILNASDIMRPINRYRTFKKVERAIEEKDYKLADELLKDTPQYERCWDWPTNYVHYLEESEETDEVVQLYPWIDRLPDNYDGYFAKELKDAKKKLQPIYEVEYPIYVAEQERLEKERKRKEEEERIEKARLSIPYLGMPESEINNTILGKADSEILYNIFEDVYFDSLHNNYSWDADNGKDLVLYVECTRGVVTKVKKYNTEYYWNEYGEPDFSVYNSPEFIKKREKQNRRPVYSNSSGNNSSTKIDEFYDAQDYDDPEDFYLENEDEFYDFEDAEDYWSDYH